MATPFIICDCWRVIAFYRVLRMRRPSSIYRTVRRVRGMLLQWSGTFPGNFQESLSHWQGPLNLRAGIVFRHLLRPLVVRQRQMPETACRRDCSLAFAISAIVYSKRIRRPCTEVVRIIFLFLRLYPRRAIFEKTPHNEN